MNSDLNRSLATNLAFDVNEKYRGYVYIATEQDDEWTDRKCCCTIDKLPDLLDKLDINLLSSKVFKVNFYISNNTFKTSKGRKDNLFSYNNMVFDIDCHADDVSTESKQILIRNFVQTLKEEFKKDSKQEVNCEFNMESLKESKKEQNKVPIWNITHYTGRGVQLWWCFEQVASALRGPYRHTQQGIGEKIDAVLKSHKEFSQLSIDPTTYKETGYFRMFETYNSHAEAYTEVEIEHEKRYKLQDLIDALQGDLVIPHSKKQSDVKSWTFMSVMNARRMKLIEDVLKDRTDINSGKKFQYSENFSNQMNWGLLIYYNCARYSLSQEKSKSKTEKLIKYFDCVEDEELDAIYKFVDGFYDSKKILKFRNETIIQYLDLDEDEQNKYDFHAFTGEWDWAKCKPNRTRDEQRKQRKEEKYARICSLYALGYTQAQVAAEMGCNINTVNSILKKCGINRKTERILLISQLKAEHLRQKEVAEQLNISVRTVQRYWEAA